MGKVAYKLELPENARIHPVFHMALLKAKIGQSIIPIPKLPPVDALGQLAPTPTAILETRLVKRRRLPQVTQVLTQWEGSSEDDATWEWLHQLKEDYPHLVGKVL